MPLYELLGRQSEEELLCQWFHVDFLNAGVAL
jgi:hypothetical protein